MIIGNTKAKKNLDLVISFDTTGSMRHCIGDVRSRVTQFCEKVFKEIKDLKIGIVAHGDYCDGKDWYRQVDLTDDQNMIRGFIQTAPNTGGGDSPEAYEMVLKKVQEMKWRKKSQKILILIGDELPHERTERGYETVPCWRTEAQKLSDMKVQIIPVQAYTNPSTSRFHEHLARLSDGVALKLHQFSESTETLVAVAMHAVGKLDSYKEELVKTRVYSSSLDHTFSRLSGKSASVLGEKVYFGKTERAAIHPTGDFNRYHVSVDMPIKGFVENVIGAIFEKGRGYYELKKSVTVQDYKEVVLEHIETHEHFTGEAARKILGLPATGSVILKPVDEPKFRFFIQSTSINRKLLGGTIFLYRKS